MTTQITDGVMVTVETVFQSEYSDPANEHFLFAYRIRIQNLSGQKVQLLRRHWHIFDSNGHKREVEGEGVVGHQPIIESGDFHEYVSGCHLKTDTGCMWGTYTMYRETDQSYFDVVIPRFVLIAPYRLN
jgi:ApaG protein